MVSETSKAELATVTDAKGLLEVKDLCLMFRRKPLTILQWKLYHGLPYVNLKEGGRIVARYRYEDVQFWAVRHKKRIYLEACTDDQLVDEPMVFAPAVKVLGEVSK